MQQREKVKEAESTSLQMMEKQQVKEYLQEDNSTLVARKQIARLARGIRRLEVELLSFRNRTIYEAFTQFGNDYKQQSEMMKQFEQRKRVAVPPSQISPLRILAVRYFRKSCTHFVLLAGRQKKENAASVIRRSIKAFYFGMKLKDLVTKEVVGRQKVSSE